MPTKTASKTTSTSDVNTANVSTKKSNKGCWIAAGVGCFIFAIISIIIVVLIIWGISVAASSDISETVLRSGYGGKLAVIPVEGVISESGGGSSLLSEAGTSSDTVINLLDKALNDSDVKGIVLKMNTPGGEVVASNLVYRKVMEVRDVKPVVTWMSGMGASGGYYIAAGCDKIVAHPQTMTGSIGVIQQLTNMSKLYEKVGIETKTYTSGPYKDLTTEAFDPNSDGAVDDMFQSLVDESYEDFITAIVDGRGMDRSDVEKLADGRLFSGYQALENGLIDEVGTMDDAISTTEELAGTSGLSVVEYTTGGLLDSLSMYQNSILEKLQILPQKTTYGAGLYYLLDI